jgi:hypothetical protein
LLHGLQQAERRSVLQDQTTMMSLRTRGNLTSRSLFTQGKVEFILEKECIFLIENVSFNIRFQEET